MPKRLIIRYIKGYFLTGILNSFEITSSHSYIIGIAFRKGWITADKMRELAKPMLKNQYGQYLLQVVEEVERTGKANL